jgi:peptidoglycan/xylan/chitin deacetylase (PgdA/CDA1 family)
MSDNRCYITTSWDDGYPLDLRLCEMLRKYNLPATFYVPRENSEYTVINENQIRSISKEFEIGGHTLSHKRLTSIPPHDSLLEITGCKKWIEDTIGKSPTSFSPPGGVFNKRIANQITEAGFDTIRTTTMLSLEQYQDNKNIINTSVLLYPHKKITYYKHFTKRMMANSLFWFLRNNSENDLIRLTEKLINRLIKKGGVLHIWGHSWEIEENSLWKTTEIIFRMMSNISEVRYVSNGELRKQ